MGSWTGDPAGGQCSEHAYRPTAAPALMTQKWQIKHGKFEIEVSKDPSDEFTNLNIVPVERAFPHNQQVSLRVRGAESLLTESQEASGTGQVEQRWDPVGHSIGLLVEKHSPRREVW